jgi:lactoylglutathione lyase
MDLGWLDVCLRVANVQRSRAFYEGLGFRRVEGEDDEGWAVVVNGNARIGLFEASFMNDAYSLNFRGGNMQANVSELKNRGYGFESEPVVKPDGSGSARLRDPDGNLVFLDCAPGEVKLRSSRWGSPTRIDLKRLQQATRLPVDDCRFCRHMLANPS